MRALSWISRLRKNQRGNVLIVTAATMPLVIGSAAIGLDTLQMALWKRQLQRSADSAALAGAFALVQTKSATAAAQRDLTLNNKVTLSAPADIQPPPLAGPFAGNPRAVRVILAAQRTFPFMGFFTGSTPTIQVEATANVVFQGQFCMVSLEEGNVTGITFTGNTQIDLGCGVMSNSRASNAVVASGSARVTASPIGAVGGVPASSGYVQPTTLVPFTSKQTDPYAGLPRAPSPPANCNNIGPVSVLPNRVQTVSASPSTDSNYCIKGGMDVKGTLNLAPGTYYIDGGLLSLGSQSVLTGSGVTIVLTSSTPTDPTSFADVSINGGATVNLTSPDTGTYKGILFYQDPRTPYGNSTINGNSTSSLQGGIYFPSRQLTFNGTAGLQTQCLQLVARRLVFSGTSTVQNTCPTNGGAKAFDANFVRLVA